LVVQGLGYWKSETNHSRPLCHHWHISDTLITYDTQMAMAITKISPYGFDHQMKEGQNWVLSGICIRIYVGKTTNAGIILRLLL